MLDALPPRAPHPAPGRETGQHEVDHRRLAKPHVATHKAEPAAPSGSVLEPLLQERDVAMAPHDRSSRQRRGYLHISPGEKAIPLLADCLQIVRCGR